jgi:hypothetical protein
MCSGVLFLPISGAKQEALCIHAHAKVTPFPLLLIDTLILNFKSRHLGLVWFGGHLESRLTITQHNVHLVLLFPFFSITSGIDFPELSRHVTTWPLQHSTNETLRYLREANLSSCFRALRFLPLLIVHTTRHDTTCDAIPNCKANANQRERLSHTTQTRALHGL